MKTLQQNKPLPVGEHETDKWKAHYFEYNDSYISIYKNYDGNIAPYTLAINDIWQKGNFPSIDIALTKAVELSS